MPKGTNLNEFKRVKSPITSQSSVSCFPLSTKSKLVWHFMQTQRIRIEGNICELLSYMIKQYSSLNNLNRKRQFEKENEIRRIVEIWVIWLFIIVQKVNMNWNWVGEKWKWIKGREYCICTHTPRVPRGTSGWLAFLCCP